MSLIFVKRKRDEYNNTDFASIIMPNKKRAVIQTYGIQKLPKYADVYCVDENMYLIGFNNRTGDVCVKKSENITNTEDEYIYDAYILEEDQTLEESDIDEDDSNASDYYERMMCDEESDDYGSHFEQFSGESDWGEM
jgi:hypothetical protein